MSHHRNPSVPAPTAASVPTRSTSIDYPADDGQLSEDQLEAIRQLVVMPEHPTVLSTLLAVGLNDEAIKPGS